MKNLIKLFLIIGSVFISTFLIIKLMGILTSQQIEGWLIQAQNISPVYVGIIIALILFSDLFIAIPTLTVVILSGYFLGHTYGAIAALTGTMLAGICGYVISRYCGNRIMSLLIKDMSERIEVNSTFEKSGFAMIILSRAAPILPETSACLAGMTKMAFSKFFLAWSISTIPYVLIATYAGSISSATNIQPAIFTAIFISLFLWMSWFIYHRYSQRKEI